MPPPSKPVRTASGTRPRPARVLLVEDEVVVAESLRLVLASEFEVIVTTHPRDALAMISGGQTFDVILCDVMMPDLNGVELRERIDRVAPDQAARIVFITGGLPLSHVRELVNSVPNTCLEKPLDFDGLRELIRRRVRVPASEAPSGGESGDSGGA